MAAVSVAVDSRVAVVDSRAAAEASAAAARREAGSVHMRAPHRILRHVVTDHLSVRRTFPHAALERIEHAIAAGERGHRGQICFAVEGALPPLRVWDTEDNAGVLVYLLLADRDVEIVADRGIDRRVPPGVWKAICTRMEAEFREGRFVEGIAAGIGEIGALLAAHFPHTADAANELPDKPVIL
ncbi:MAG TPA: TPM domain-containing protein [Thermomicrobiales bacterium]|nr:TPM domain-containing protein [Thermomicrobiales bacterium]